MESPLKRQNSLPILHVEGSFYEVGYNVGRTFCGLIKTVLDCHPLLNGTYIPAYNTPKGKVIYEEILQAVTEYYPDYLKELQGISDGAGVPFYKLFLLHTDDVLPGCISEITEPSEKCSSVCMNRESHEIIGHTEDGAKEMLNNVFILNAKYTDLETKEHLMAFCYAGLLPGYAMGFNKHGLLFTINVICAQHLGRGRLPRTFVTRALLAADNFDAVMKTLECEGKGIADAMSVNLTFLNEPGNRVFYNIEVSPSYPLSSKSQTSVLTIPRGDVYFHANKFLHLDVPALQGSLQSSNARHETRAKYNLNDTKCVYNLLSDTCIFRDNEKGLTLAVGIFNCVKRTWSIYLDQPNKSEPIAIFPLDMK